MQLTFYKDKQNDVNRSQSSNDDKNETLKDVIRDENEDERFKLLAMFKNFNNDEDDNDKNELQEDSDDNNQEDVD